jgi:lysophospholipase L1-like esterase
MVWFSLSVSPGIAQTASAPKGASAPMTGTYYAIGDSITNDPAIALQFPQVIVAHFPGLTLENVAVGGTGEAFAFKTELPRIPAAGSGCRLVTIETGGNDLRWGTPVATVASQFTQLYKDVRERCPHATIVVATYINNAGQPGANPAPGYEANLNSYNQWLRTFAKQNQLPLVDLDADKRFNHPPPTPLMRNWAHPSEAGNQLVGQDFVNAINAARSATPSP